MNPVAIVCTVPSSLFWADHFAFCIQFLFAVAVSFQLYNRFCKREIRSKTIMTTTAAATTTTTAMDMATTKSHQSCPICLEKISNIPTIALTTASCNHQFCKPCLEEWILRLERMNTDQDPSCPECRCPLSHDEITSILGRPLRKSSSSSSPPQRRGYEDVINEDDTMDPGRFEPDEFTRVYLENLEADGIARRCPSCKIWIIREYGCDNVMCRCGCKFCFCCGKRGSCAGETFFNNILAEEDYEEFIGRDNAYEFEEDEDSMIYPLFQGDDWFVEYEPNRIDPLFVGEVWIPIEVEKEDSKIEPLFQGDDWMPPEIEAEETRVTPLFTGDWNMEY